MYRPRSWTTRGVSISGEPCVGQPRSAMRLFSQTACRTKTDVKVVFVSNALGCVKWVQTADLDRIDFKVAVYCEECEASHRMATCSLRGHGGEPS